MRIVLDTNILARPAYSATGPAAAALDLVKNSPHVLITSLFILDELDRVLRYPRLRDLHGLSDDEIVAYVQGVEATSLVVETPSGEVAKVVTRDPDDDPIVATAEAGTAEIICTLDKHLRHSDVQTYCRQRGIRILTDIALLEELRALATDDDASD